MEVLRDIDWHRLQKKVVPLCSDVDGRCPLVLRACPYLQHLHLYVDGRVCETSAHAETFARVPRLRSLHLEQRHHNRGTRYRLHDCQAMLDSLPHLHTLNVTHIKHLGTKVLLDIAAHSTLRRCVSTTAMCIWRMPCGFDPTYGSLSAWRRTSTC